MNRFSKTGVVLAGYAGALLVTCAIFYVYELMQKATSAQASGGMQAFGDSLLFVGLFGFLALIPTALALYYLRPVEKFWKVFSGASLALAATGPVAAVMMGRSHQSPGVILVVGLFALLKVLGAPLLGVGFLICAVIAPTQPNQRSRWLLVTAATIEFAVSAYVFLCLFIFGHWL